MHLELPVVSFLCALLVLMPLPWHWRARTVPTISISLWLFAANIINGVNAIIWIGNVRIVAQVWCDITTKIIVGGTVALPASLFCLCMQLERVSSVRQVSTTVKDKRRRRIIDAVLCFGVPAIYMALHYIVQGHRFDIVEDFGCRPNTYVSIPSVVLVWIPPAFFSVSAAILASFALHHFLVRRITFARHLQNSNSALTPSRYFRLMSMALVQIFWGIFVTAVNMWFTMKGGLRPWTDWVDVHWDFSRVSQFPALFIPPTYWLYTYLLWWTIPISSILFWGFFSFGEDAMREYRACLSWIKRHIFRRPENSSKADIVNVSLPSFCRSPNSPLSSKSNNTFVDDSFVANKDIPSSPVRRSDASSCYIPYHPPYTPTEPDVPPSPTEVDSTLCAVSEKLGDDDDDVKDTFSIRKDTLSACNDISSIISVASASSFRSPRS